MPALGLPDMMTALVLVFRCQEYRQLAMGQGQEDAARKMITEAILNGHWLMLQNCHLCLEFCDEIMQTLVDTEDIHPLFR